MNDHAPRLANKAAREKALFIFTALLAAGVIVPALLWTIVWRPL